MHGFMRANDFSEGVASVAVGKDCRQATMNESYDWVRNPKVDCRWGFIDKCGKVVIEPQFQFAGSFSEGRAIIAEGSTCEGDFNARCKFGYINRAGTIVILPQFEEANPFHDGFALVKFGGRYGFINQDGQWLVPPSFDYAESFGNGLAFVQIFGQPSRGARAREIRQGDQHGYLNRNGEFVRMTRYD